ncbi:hypothetical protein SH139x_001962 [Planctomycetaceae bacterium SH139]
MSTVIQIAESVTAQLNSASFSQTFTAKRLYVPNFDLEELSELHVSVVPRDVLLSALDRLTNRYNVRIDIAVQQKFESGANAEIDPLLNLIEEISDLFRLKRLGSLPAARCITIEHPVIYSVEHWEQQRQFTSLLTLTFQLAR